jgi:hypothetical protein
MACACPVARIWCFPRQGRLSYLAQDIDRAKMLFFSNVSHEAPMPKNQITEATMPIHRQPHIATPCRKQSALCRRPLLQNPSSLPDRQPRPRSPSDEALEDTLSLSEAVPRKQQLGDPLPIPAPLLDLLEVAPVGVERVVGFFVGPVVGHRRI